MVVVALLSVDLVKSVDLVSVDLVVNCIAKNVDFYVQNWEIFQCFLMSKPHQFTLFSYFYVYFMPKTKGFMPLTT